MRNKVIGHKKTQKTKILVLLPPQILISFRAGDSLALAPFHFLARNPSLSVTVKGCFRRRMAGLPDFSCRHNIPNWGSVYQMTTKYTKGWQSCQIVLGITYQIWNTYQNGITYQPKWQNIQKWEYIPKWENITKWENIPKWEDMPKWQNIPNWERCTK
jgi:hypothetical protein